MRGNYKRKGSYLLGIWIWLKSFKYAQNLSFLWALPSTFGYLVNPLFFKNKKVKIKKRVRKVVFLGSHFANCILKWRLWALQHSGSDESQHKAIGKYVALWRKEKGRGINWEVAECIARALKLYRPGWVPAVYYCTEKGKAWLPSMNLYFIREVI
jgi:hypothetical protein